MTLRLGVCVYAGIDLGNVGFVTLLPYIAIFFFDSSWSKLMDKMLQQSNEESMSGPSFIQRRFGCFSRILCPKRFAASKVCAMCCLSLHCTVCIKLTAPNYIYRPCFIFGLRVGITTGEGLFPPSCNSQIVASCGICFSHPFSVDFNFSHRCITLGRFRICLPVVLETQQIVSLTTRYAQTFSICTNRPLRFSCVWVSV